MTATRQWCSLAKKEGAAQSAAGARRMAGRPRPRRGIGPSVECGSRLRCPAAEYETSNANVVGEIRSRVRCQLSLDTDRFVFVERGLSTKQIGTHWGALWARFRRGFEESGCCPDRRSSAPP